MTDRYASRPAALGMEPTDKCVSSDVSEIERTIGVSLPPEYKTFLQQCAGWWGDVCCLSEEPTPFGDHVLCGIHDADDIAELLYSMITPRNMITIAAAQKSLPGSASKRLKMESGNLLVHR